MDDSDTHDAAATGDERAVERPGDGPPGDGRLGDGPPGDGREERTRDGGRGASPRIARATRRSVLGVVAGAATAAVVGGVASGSPTGGPSPGEASATAARGGVAGPNPDRRFDAVGAESAAALDPPRTLGEVWRQGFTGEVVALPFVPRDSNSNRIYALGTAQTRLSTTVYALDRDSGEVAWQQDVGLAPPTLAWNAGEALYLGKGAVAPSATTELVARAADDGSVQWRNASSFGSETRVQPVHVPGDSTVYAVTTGPTVVALDEATGNEQWRVDVGEGAVPVVAATAGTGSRLFVTSNELSSTSNNAFVTAVDRTARTELWTRERAYPVGSNLQVVGGTVYSGFTAPNVDESVLVAFDAASGAEQWSKTRTDGLGWGFVISHGSGVYGLASVNRNGTTDGEMVKFDGDGRSQWTYDAGAMILGTQTVSDAVYVATRDGRVAEVSDPSTGGGGTESWSRTLNDGIRDGALRKAGDVLYTGTISRPGRVYALDAASGSTIDTFDLSGGVTGGTVVFDDRIWVAARPPYDTTTGDSAIYELGDGDADDGSGNGGGNGDGDGDQHESGVPQELFDAVTGTDGNLDRQDILDLVRAYVSDGTVGGVSVTREDVLALVRYYVL